MIRWISFLGYLLRLLPELGTKSFGSNHSGQVLHCNSTRRLILYLSHGRWSKPARLDRREIPRAERSAAVACGGNTIRSWSNLEIKPLKPWCRSA